ncbi:NADH-ubiquinone oxidoreductase chain N [Dehalococcoides mccartyi]|jgi:NADH-quinone oxidoreductase subunit N|uniref:NADH-quinone oxidoreductase subunit N n=1 Tax=Dehalococcoides mccartyi TaxID=61435 RepID=A0A328EQS5_9CHLR|nr:NADH-quinone oxidoreductase subunit N [Dehalococcoides mccartyi]AGG06478.1 NADH ubiquinone oxidoreductase chain N [Dehalococcoides mccartyi DCMB5]RAL69731.1 NADH-ubiquinone oxidoreductase chain N [Dehalococcoides mccartyi]RAL71058.1 NADH-ubiquinone oxidoreductase chain N [Dehalococcoides mccartyi]BAS31886.1 proton-translocating NADH-quinone oxidoreductase,chain N [Dehalococcoides mccartyi IBARAKI]
MDLFMPEIIILITALLVIITDLFLTKSKRHLAYLSLLGLGAAAVATVLNWNNPPELAFGGMWALDGYASFFRILFISLSGLVIMASIDYVNKFRRFQGEYYALVLLALLGMIMMASTTNLITMYLSLELAGLAFYVLVGFLKDQHSTESALKYLLLGGVASAMLVFGLVLIYGFSGETNLGSILNYIQTLPSGMDITAHTGFILGIILTITGLGFKVAAVPFQFWAPDVYQGSPTPITLYLSIASKAAGFALFLRLFYTLFTDPLALSQEWALIVAVLATAGMTLGNVLAIPQKNIKRMLGYSSIAHAGYILVALAAVGNAPELADGRISLLFYLVAFAVSDLVAFVSIIAISRSTGSDEISSYEGLAKTNPVYASALTLALLSLTGFPPLAGFLAKYYIFSAAVQADLLWLMIVAAVNTVISAVFYFNVIRVMWLRQPREEVRVLASWPLKLALGISGLAVLIFGIVPEALLNLIENATELIIH